MEAAWKLLEGEDPRKSRMGDVARAVGISRQALYLHFPSRTELLVATARHLDAVKDVDARLQPSRSAATGLERLDAFIDAFGNYIPEVFGVARALRAMMDTDEAARAAWNDRLGAIRQGCHAAVRDLRRDGQLQAEWTEITATDWLWALLSFGNWEMLVRDCGWSQKAYVSSMQRLARQTLVARP